MLCQTKFQVFDIYSDSVLFMSQCIVKKHSISCFTNESKARKNTEKKFVWKTSNDNNSPYFVSRHDRKKDAFSHFLWTIAQSRRRMLCMFFGKYAKIVCICRGKHNLYVWTAISTQFPRLNSASVELKLRAKSVGRVDFVISIYVCWLALFPFSLAISNMLTEHADVTCFVRYAA